GLPRLDVEHVHRVPIERIRHDVAVVPGPEPKVAVLVEPLPGRAAVIRPKEPAGFGLDDRPHALGARWRHDDADLALEAGRQAGIVAQILPGVAAVRRSPEPASGPTAREAPRRAQRLPKRRVDDARIGARDRQIHGAGPIADEVDALPVAASVSRAIHAALGVRSERVA